MAMKNKKMSKFITKGVVFTILFAMGTGTVVSVYSNITTANAGDVEAQISKAVETIDEKEFTIETLITALENVFKEGGTFTILNKEDITSVTHKHFVDEINFNVKGQDMGFPVKNVEMTMTGEAKASIDVTENLKSFEVIKTDDNKIKILVSYPKLEQDSIKIDKDSIKIDESKTTNNFDDKKDVLGDTIYNALLDKMTSLTEEELKSKITNTPMTENEESMDEIYEKETKAVEYAKFLVSNYINNIYNAFGTSPEFEIEYEIRDSKLSDDYKPTQELVDKIEKDLNDEFNKGFTVTK